MATENKSNKTNSKPGTPFDDATLTSIKIPRRFTTKMGIFFQKSIIRV